jgi:hypothetical protein
MCRLNTLHKCHSTHSLFCFVAEGSSEGKTDELRENGTAGGASDEDRHDMSALSVGDITIDSVKDHLL